MSQPTEIPRRPAVDVFALFAVEPDGSSIRDFLGTGFLLAGGILVTCWHCVRGPVEAGLVVAAVQGGDDFIPAFVLRDLAQDRNGSDLATARLDRVQLFGLELATASVDTGTDVWSYGYPLTDPPDERRPTYRLNARYLEGYVTRAFYYSDKRVPSYELDMRAPAGLSGAPVVEVGSKRVIGVVYGVEEVERIEIFGRTDPETRERTPDVVRLETFALAHYTDTLRTVVGPATGGRQLAEAVDDAAAAAEREFAQSPLIRAARRAREEQAPKE
jgi:Trypsin-like peptidase domain